MKVPASLVWDNRLPEVEKTRVAELNASLARLNEQRAIEISVSGPFARSKIAWKLAIYHHALLHRIVALMDGAAVAWNRKCTLSAMLSARALMETITLIAELERRIVYLLTREDLGGLDAIAQNGIFASRDPEWIAQFPESKAINILTCIEKFDRTIPGFKGQYERLSERCHPNSLGHNFMFSVLDRSSGTVAFCDEREPERNGQMIFAALAPLPLVESMSTRLHDLIMKVSDLHHRFAPVGRGPAPSEQA
jgi:hypothetical protein